MLSKKIGMAVLALVGFMPATHALVPLEGLVLGEVQQDLQPDSLRDIFSTQIAVDLNTSARHKMYRAIYQEAQDLERSCAFVGRANYANPISEIVARRTIVANLQYLGLDLTVKAIGSYGKTLQMPEEEYTRLVDNLMKNSCSPNMSVYGLRLIKQNLMAAYRTETPFGLPIFPYFPQGADELANKASSLETRETEFHHTVKNFRALCSWGGDVNNYRMLPALLNSPQVMSMVLRYMEGKTLSFDPKTTEILRVDHNAERVSCEGPLCRATSSSTFQRQFPRMIGSSGLAQDLQRQWCEHFRDQRYLTDDSQTSQVRQWIGQRSVDDDRKDVASMMSLFTNVSDLVLGTKQYQELAQDLRRPIESRWNRWAQNSLKFFSRDLFFEEPLEIKVLQQTALGKAQRNEVFALDMTVTMGELDRLLQVNDKLTIDLNFKLSRNWLRWVRTQSIQATQMEEAAQSEERLVAIVADHLRVHLNTGRTVFPYLQKSVNLEAVMAEELVSQLGNYQGRYFDDLKDQMVSIPVRLHYGLFALSYLRQKVLQKPVNAPSLPEFSTPPTTANLDL